MTSEPHEQGERLTRPAMIEEFQQARRRHQSARDQTLVRRVDGSGKPLPLADAALRTPEDTADWLDLVRWGSDKG
jgi:hypothetical protein